MTISYSKSARLFLSNKGVLPKANGLRQDYFVTESLREHDRPLPVKYQEVKLVYPEREVIAVTA